MSSGPYSSGLAMAVGFSMFIRLAKDAALPSCGVAEAMMSVSERRDRRSASLRTQRKRRAAERDIVGFVNDNDVPVALVRPDPEFRRSVSGCRWR